MEFEKEYHTLCVSLNEFDIEAIYHLFKSATSNLHRIQLVEELAGTYQCLADFLKKPSTLRQQEQLRPRKSSHRCLLALSIAGELFQRNALGEGTNSCNQSIYFGDGESLALAYGNRSRFFYNMKNETNCLYSLRDIQLALDTGNYPKNMEYELRERQGDCWLKMRDKRQAIVCYSLARDLLVNRPIDDPTKLAAILSKLSKFSNTNVDINESAISDIKWIEGKLMEKRVKVPKLSGLTNPLIPSATTAVKLCHIPGKGRGLVATEDLRIGATIIVEKAFTSILYTELEANNCHHCFHFIAAPIPCLCCAKVGFCSVVCRDEAWTTYHQHECGFVHVLEDTKVDQYTLLALRSVLKLNRDDLVRAQTSEQTLDDIYDSTNYNTIHHLVGHCDGLSGKELFRRSVLACFLIRLVRDVFDLELSAELLHLSVSFPYNVLSVSHTLLPPASHSLLARDLSTERVGYVVLPLISMMNHSCDPNVKSFSYLNIKAVKVIRPIKRGEEILTSYGYLYVDHLKDTRQTNLNRLYSFDCCCPPCSENWPRSLSSITTRPQLLKAILKDAAKFSKVRCYYTGKMREIEKWAVKFVGYLNVMDEDPSIIRPVLEYSCIQSALIICYDLMAAVAPGFSPCCSRIAEEFC